MAREPQWVELQPLTTLYLKAATDGVTQPVEHYLNTRGFDVGDTSACPKTSRWSPVRPTC